MVHGQLSLFPLSYHKYLRRTTNTGGTTATMEFLCIGVWIELWPDANELRAPEIFGCHVLSIVELSVVDLTS